MSRILLFHEYLLESDSSDPIVGNFYSAIKNTQAEESPRGSNKGPEVEPLLKNVGAGPGARDAAPGADGAAGGQAGGVGAEPVPGVEV